MDQVNMENEVLEQQAPVFCGSCGSELKQGAMFCDKCGASTKEKTHTEALSVPEQPVGRKSAFKVGMLFDIFGVVAGLLSVILGFVAYGYDTGSWEGGFTYGGDAYTGIQNAAAQTANNVQDLTELVCFGVGSVLLVAGLVICCCFGAKLYRSMQNKEN